MEERRNGTARNETANRAATQLSWKRKVTPRSRACCQKTRSKIGVRLRVTVRKIWLSYSESYPYAELFQQVLVRLQQAPLYHPPP